MWKICAKFVPRVLREDQKDVVMTAGRWSSWSIQIPQFLMLCWPAMKAGSTTMSKREFPVEACWLSQTQEGQTEQIHPQSFDPFFKSTGLIYMRWVTTGQTTNKEYYVEILREFRKKSRWKRPALFKLGQWHFHQDNAPVHNSILFTDYLTRWASRQFLTLSIVQTLLPVTFGYSLSSEAVVMKQLRRWKRLWRRSPTRSHKRTSMSPSRSCWNGTKRALQPEQITSKGTRVSCVYYQ